MNPTANPTNLDHHVFVDHIPLIRAVTKGVTDGYPRKHYLVVRQHAEAGHPVFSRSQKDPHPLFLHPRYAAPPTPETEAERAAGRDPDHRAEALQAIPPEVAAEVAALSAAQAELAGLTDARLWEDEEIPEVVQEIPVTVPARDDLGLPMHRDGRPLMVEATRRTVQPARKRLGFRSMFQARAAAGEAPSAEPSPGSSAHQVEGAPAPTPEPDPEVQVDAATEEGMPEPPTASKAETSGCAET